MFINDFIYDAQLKKYEILRLVEKPIKNLHICTKFNNDKRGHEKLPIHKKTGLMQRLPAYIKIKRCNRRITALFRQTTA